MKTFPLLTLIADDSDDSRVLFARAVRSVPGLCVAAVTTDGVDTLAYMNGCVPYNNRVKFPYPDLILLDYQMPGYNGLEVLMSLRGLTPHPKVILWSDAIDAIDQILAYQMGADFVCSKPILSQEIETVLKRVQPWTFKGGINTFSSASVSYPRLECCELRS